MSNCNVKLAITSSNHMPSFTFLAFMVQYWQPWRTSQGLMSRSNGLFLSEACIVHPVHPIQCPGSASVARKHKRVWVFWMQWLELLFLTIRIRQKVLLVFFQTVCVLKKYFEMFWKPVSLSPTLMKPWWDDVRVHFTSDTRMLSTSQT